MDILEIRTEAGFVSWEVMQDCVGIDEDGTEIMTEEYILIDTVHVYPEYRKQGHARKMLTQAIEDIKKSDYNLIRINAMPENEDYMSFEDLVSFYESVGFDLDEDQDGGQTVHMEMNI